MIKNHLLIAYRALRSSKLFATISILGLTIGITVCLAIMIVVQYELSFNQAIPDKDRIYRISTRFSGVYSAINRGVPAPVAPFMRETFTGLETVAQFHGQYFKIKIREQGEPEKKFEYYDKIILADKNYFELLGSYQWLAGNAETALAGPHQLVLTASRAKIYFGDIPYPDMLQKQVFYEDSFFSDSLRVQVTGIVDDLTIRTDFDFTDFVSLATIEKSWLKNNMNQKEWGNTNSSSQAFVKLAQGTSLGHFKDQIKSLEEKRAEASPDPNSVVNFTAQSLNDLHFDTEFGIFDSVASAISIKTLGVLFLVGVLILLIASINFINLETAQAGQRAKEIGVRKVMGASKHTILWQFLTQSLLVTCIACLLALPLVQLFFVLMSDFIPSRFAFDIFDPVIYAISFGIILIVGVLSGLYPAFIMSSFQPVQAMKSQIYTAKGKNQSAMLRKGLTVFQFGFAQVLIAFTLISLFQMDYLKQHNLGFDQSDRLFMYLPWDVSKSKKEVFINQLPNLPEVAEFSTHGRSPATPGSSTTTIELLMEDSTKQVLNVHWSSTDQHYFGFYGLELMAGRVFTAADSVPEIVVNEGFIRGFGMPDPQSVLGTRFTISSKDYVVTGVVKDFHFQSLHNAIAPQAFRYSKLNNGLGIRLAKNESGNSQQEAIDNIQSIWSDVFPDNAMPYSFVSDQVDKYYANERKMTKLIYLATSLAIFISCMGLFGLASFTVMQRTKEIGIRKVLGATVQQVIGLISKDFVVLVIISFVLAAPIAYILANGWLENFVFHYEPSVWVFLLTCGITIMIAFATLLYQTLRTAKANPVESLRNE